MSRLRMLAPDGLVVYDIQDEPGRSGQARPFQFLPTVDPEVYAYDALAELAIPKIVYRCVGAHSREVFSSWSTPYGPGPTDASASSLAHRVVGRASRGCRWQRPIRSRSPLPTYSLVESP